MLLTKDCFTIIAKYLAPRDIISLARAGSNIWRFSYEKIFIQRVIDSSLILESNQRKNQAKALLRFLMDFLDTASTVSITKIIKMTVIRMLGI